MGCVSSKQAVAVTPTLDLSGTMRENVGEGGGEGEKGKRWRRKGGKKTAAVCGGAAAEGGGGGVVDGGESVSFRLGNVQRYMEGELVAAGWPAWLSAVAGDAIRGWLPLRAESFQKLDKIGQGTYSSVFRAREIASGRVVALKKVQLDNFEPESVRFMAREVLILRRLNHPNIVKLEGVITSRQSSSMYLVFEYMEHDLTGLLASPDVNFHESQSKCYMKQLLSGIAHCHSQGVMHRDIKGSNLLVNNEGVLKIADFGLANFCPTDRKQPLTSRVVTLWYRPPELLLGSTDYGVSVDMWSVGCVFAEILLGRPLLQGRTEVEQLHKIFKLCGSPPEEYWKTSRLPHVTLFKPHNRYESSLREVFDGLPAPSVKLVETLLSIEPYKRGTASSALASEYFRTKPLACDPSTLPKYPPNKEMDVKAREEESRKLTNRRARGPESKKPARKTNKALGGGVVHLVREGDALAEGDSRGNRADDMSEMSLASPADVPYSGPIPASGAWAAEQPQKEESRQVKTRGSTGELSSGSSSRFGSRRSENEPGLSRNACKTNSQWSAPKRWGRFDPSDSFHGPHPGEGAVAGAGLAQEMSYSHYRREEAASARNNMVYEENGEKVEFSGPLLSQTHQVDELLKKHERHIRQAVRRSWFQRGKKQQGK